MGKIKKFNESNNDEYKFDGSLSKHIDIPYVDVIRTNVEIDDMVGKTIMDVLYNYDEMLMVCLSNDKKSRVYYSFYHSQDCCEVVWLDDIVGDLDDLINTPILKAEKKEDPNRNDEPKNGSMDESHTWTFYTLATINGYVDFRWIGTSNGYYSEGVDICRTTNEIKTI